MSTNPYLGAYDTVYWKVIPFGTINLQGDGKGTLGYTKRLFEQTWTKRHTEEKKFRCVNWPDLFKRKADAQPQEKTCNRPQPTPKVTGSGLKRRMNKFLRPRTNLKSWSHKPLSTMVVLPGNSSTNKWRWRC